MGAEQSQQTASAEETEELTLTDEPIGEPSALVVCGPSGVGKGTLIELLLEDSEGYAFSISHTTRNPRGAEKDGVEYHFVDRATFEKGIDNGTFLEFAEVHGNYYGTSRAAVERVLDSGTCCVLDIDVQGARKVRKSGLSAVFVFIAPPSEEELEKRLRGRGTDSAEQIHQRLKTARQEMQSMREPGLFDFCIINDDLSKAYAELKLIAAKARNGQLVSAAENGDLSPVKKAKAEGVPHVAGMEDWKEKIALVTDAGSTLGMEICGALFQEGLRLIAVGRTREGLEKLQSNLMSSGHSILVQNFLPVVCDMTKEGEVRSLRKIAQKRWPKASSVDVLVNLSSHVKKEAGLIEGSTAAWVDMLSSNVLGTLLCSREVIKDMRTHEEESYIINICVTDAQTPPESIPLFHSIRQALLSLTHDLRNEVQEKSVGAHVVCVTGDGPVESANVTRAVLAILASHLDVGHVQL